MSLTAERLFEFLNDDLGIDIDGLRVQSELFSTGIVDSFSLVSLMGFLEDMGGFRIDPGDVTLENLDSVERILRFFERFTKRG